MSKASHVMLYVPDFTKGAQAFLREKSATNAIFSIATPAHLKSALKLYSGDTSGEARRGFLEGERASEGRGCFERCTLNADR